MLNYFFPFRLPADLNKKLFLLRATSSARPNQGKNPKKNLALFPNFISFRPPQKKSTPDRKWWIPRCSLYSNSIVNCKLSIQYLHTEYQLPGLFIRLSKIINLIWRSNIAERKYFQFFNNKIITAKFKKNESAEDLSVIFPQSINISIYSLAILYFKIKNSLYSTPDH